MDLAANLAPTGRLRAVINLGNPVLAQGTPDGPRGVTVALADAVAAWLGVPLDLICVDAARHSVTTMTAGAADLCFLAVDPAREDAIRFTAPYVLIEGVYVVTPDAPFAAASDVDRPGVRVGVREGSAYDLFLSRALKHAEVVRADDATDVYEGRGLEVCAGVRQPMSEYAVRSGRRVLEPPFMQIAQAVGVPRSVDGHAAAALARRVEQLKADGTVARALADSGVEATVAPPA